jgi:hypothetical protein
MSNSHHPEDPERNLFDPFPEPRTIPSGWELTDMLGEKSPKSDEELKLPPPEQRLDSSRLN